MYEYFDNAVSRLPIHRLDVRSEREAALRDKIVAEVTKIRDAKGKLQTAASPDERDGLTVAYEIAKSKLDEIVGELYGLSAEDMTLLQSALSETETSSTQPVLDLRRHKRMPDRA